MNKIMKNKRGLELVTSSGIYLCNPIQKVIIIPVSSDPLNLKNIEWKGTKYKTKPANCPNLPF